MQAEKHTMVVTRPNSPFQQVPATPNIYQNHPSYLASPLNAVVPQVSQQQYLRPSPFIGFMTPIVRVTPKTPCGWHMNMGELLWSPVMTPKVKNSPKSDQVVPEKELKHKAPFSPASGNKELDKSTELSVDDSDSAEVDILDIIDREYMEVTSADIFHDFFTKYEDLFS